MDIVDLVNKKESCRADKVKIFNLISYAQINKINHFALFALLELSYDRETLKIKEEKFFDYKNKLDYPAEPIESPWRKDKDAAESININVGGRYTTSKTKPGFRNVTGSEGCFTVCGGNEGIPTLQADIDSRQEKLKKANKPTNITIEVDRRENVNTTIEVPKTN
ncbi:hypothetical protein [Flavobacterium sp. N502540]|uniref:hypothetical protein n=1 Tax=Flavobacterium sp. N502540 TaxID=2986838 RepID=UPI002225220A|nr:hypothetical protein [Flavobacterium sp. N502540]